MMPAEDAVRVGIHHEHWMAARVQKDGIRRFRTDPMNGQQLLSQFRRGRTEHAGQRTAVPLAKKSDEGLQLLGLLPEVSRRTDQPRQPCCGDAFHAGWSQQVRATQVRQRLFDVCPGRALRQDRAHDHLKGCFRRPPAHRSQRRRKRLEVFLQRRGYRNISAAADLADRSMQQVR
jgi:hypothetical protein